MNFIKIIAKKDSGFPEGSELFCDGGTFYAKKRMSYDTYRTYGFKRPFNVVGVDEVSGEIVRRPVNQEDVYVIIPDRIEYDEYNTLKRLVELELTRLETEINNLVTIEPVHMLEKELKLEKVEELKTILEKLNKLIN